MALARRTMNVRTLLDKAMKQKGMYGESESDTASAVGIETGVNTSSSLLAQLLSEQKKTNEHLSTMCQLLAQMVVEGRDTGKVLQNGMAGIGTAVSISSASGMIAGSSDLAYHYGDVRIGTKFVLLAAVIRHVDVLYRRESESRGAHRSTSEESNTHKLAAWISLCNKEGKPESPSITKLSISSTASQALASVIGTPGKGAAPIVTKENLLNSIRDDRDVFSAVTESARLVLQFPGVLPSEAIRAVHSFFHTILTVDRYYCPGEGDENKHIDLMAVVNGLNGDSKRRYVTRLNGEGRRVVGYYLSAARASGSP